jgi:hypothetical protein
MQTDFSLRSRSGEIRRAQSQSADVIGHTLCVHQYSQTWHGIGERDEKAIPNVAL